MVKRLLSVVAIAAITVMSASAMKAVHLEPKQQWAEYGLTNKTPFTIDQYVGYKVTVANITGNFQVTLGSIETHEETVDWSENPIQQSDVLKYIPLTEGVNEYNFKADIEDGNCTGVKYMNCQFANEDATGCAIDILEVILITADGEEYVSDLGVDAWGGGAYTATEIEDETPVDPSEPDTHGKSIVVKSVAKADGEGNPWDTQFFFTIGEANAVKAGDAIEYSFEFKADKAADCGGAQWHGAPGAYMHWAGAPVNCSTNWKSTSFSTTVGTDEEGAYTIAVNLTQDEAVTYYFDNVSFKVNGVEKIVNGDIEGDDYTCFLYKEQPANAIEVVDADHVGNAAGIENVMINANDNGAIYNVMGIQVNENYKGIVIRNGKKYIQK